MRSLARLPHKKLTSAYKPRLLKLALRSPADDRPRLFYIDRRANLIEFNNLLKAEFALEQDFEVRCYDAAGQPAAVERTAWPAAELGRLCDESFLELRHPSRPGQHFEVKCEVFGSAVHKELLVDAAERALGDGLFGAGNDRVDADRFDEFVKTRFCEKFKNQHRASLEGAARRAERGRRTLDTIQAHLEAFHRASERVASRPVLWMTGLSVANFAVLFTLTFFVYDWNVIEPISYLISLGAQIALIAGYLRLRKSVDSEFLYRAYMRPFARALREKRFYTSGLAKKTQVFDAIRRIGQDGKGC